MKTCHDCHQAKSLTDFHSHSATKDGRHTYCKSCAGKRVRLWKQQNPVRSRQKQRAYRIKHKFGISESEYDALIEKGCAICHSKEKIVLDHCHNSGQVRNALCVSCNLMIGMAKDDPGILKAGIEYLETHYNSEKN